MPTYIGTSYNTYIPNSGRITHWCMIVPRASIEQATHFSLLLGSALNDPLRQSIKSFLYMIPAGMINIPPHHVSRNSELRLRATPLSAKNLPIHTFKSEGEGGSQCIPYFEESQMGIS